MVENDTYVHHYNMQKNVTELIIMFCRKDNQWASNWGGYFEDLGGRRPPLQFSFPSWRSKKNVLINIFVTWNFLKFRSQNQLPDPEVAIRPPNPDPFHWSVYSIIHARTVVEDKWTVDGCGQWLPRDRCCYGNCPPPPPPPAHCTFVMRVAVTNTGQMPIFITQPLPQRPKARWATPEWRLGQLNWRRGSGRHDLCSDGSCKGRKIPAQLRAMVNFSCRCKYFICTQTYSTSSLKTLMASQVSTLQCPCRLPGQYQIPTNTM